MKLSEINNVKPIDNRRAWLLVRHFMDLILDGSSVDANLEKVVRHLYYVTKINDLTAEDQVRLNAVLQYAKNISNRQLDVYDETL